MPFLIKDDAKRKDLWDEIISITVKVKSLGALVQNEIPISHSDETDTMKRVDECINDLKNLKLHLTLTLNKNYITQEEFDRIVNE